MKYLLLTFTVFSFQIFSMEPLRNSNKTSLEASIAKFGFAFLKKLNKTEKNIIYSPFSITASLFVLSYGSNDKTNEEIRKALNHNLPDEKLPSAYNRLYTNLFISENPYDFSLANLAFIDVNTPVLPIFEKAAIANFHVKIEKGSFSGNQKSEISKINKVTEYKVDLNQKAISFNVNSLFYIIICDLKSKTILFIEKIHRPYEFI